MCNDPCFASTSLLRRKIEFLHVNASLVYSYLLIYELGDLVIGLESSQGRPTKLVEISNWVRSSIFLLACGVFIFLKEIVLLHCVDA